MINKSELLKYFLETLAKIPEDATVNRLEVNYNKGGNYITVDFTHGYPYQMENATDKYLKPVANSS
jgi:hypothetical protein